MLDYQLGAHIDYLQGIDTWQLDSEAIAFSPNGEVASGRSGKVRLGVFNNNLVAIKQYQRSMDSHFEAEKATLRYGPISSDPLTNLV